MLQFYYLYYVITNIFRFVANHPQGESAICKSAGQNQVFWTSLPHHHQQQQFTNSGSLHFLQASRMFIAPLLQFTCTEHTATDNIEVHASLQNFGSSVLTFFHGPRGVDRAAPGSSCCREVTMVAQGGGL